jgi:hypothetical protein
MLFFSSTARKQGETTFIVTQNPGPHPLVKMTCLKSAFPFHTRDSRRVQKKTDSLELHTRHHWCFGTRAPTREILRRHPDHHAAKKENGEVEEIGSGWQGPGEARLCHEQEAKRGGSAAATCTYEAIRISHTVKQTT